jgi:hypothetical protein
MIRAWFSQTAGGSCEAQSSPKPRFASHRAKAVPSEKLLVLKGFTGLSGVVEARQKGVVDHNDPAVFSRPEPPSGLRKSCARSHPFEMPRKRAARQDDDGIYGDVTIQRGVNMLAGTKPARRCKVLYRSAFTSW